MVIWRSVLRITLLAAVLVCSLHRGSAVGLIQQVSPKDPAFTQLHVLDKSGMLATARERVFPANTLHPVTRYDVALALVEPLQRFIALTAPFGAVSSSLDMHYRRELMLRTVAGLKTDEMEKLLGATNYLLQNYGDAIEAIAPGLTTPAADALKKIRVSAAGVTITDNDEKLSWRVSIDPKAELNPIGNPLPLFPLKKLEPETQPFTSEGAPPPPKALIGVLPANSMELALNAAFRGFRIYGSVSTLPGQDPTILLRPREISGSAMVGFQFNLGAFNDLGFSGNLEYYVLHNGAPNTPNTNTGAAGGISVWW